MHDTCRCRCRVTREFRCQDGVPYRSGRLIWLLSGSAGRPSIWSVARQRIILCMDKRGIQSGAVARSRLARALLRCSAAAIDPGFHVGDAGCRLTLLLHRPSTSSVTRPVMRRTAQSPAMLPHDRPLLTRRMADVLERIRRAGRPPFYTLSPREARRRLYGAAPRCWSRRARRCRGSRTSRMPAGDGTLLGARCTRRRRARCRCCCTCTAAASSIGNLETHDSLCRQLALRSGAAVVALDYRLAPEHRFPAAVDDSLGRAALAGAARRRRSASTARASRSAATAPAARWPRCARIHARDIGLPLALQLLITPGTTAHADTDVAPPVRQRLPARGRRPSRWFFDHYIDAPSSARLALRAAATPTTSKAWRRPAWSWPSATRWSTKGSPTPTSCAPPACRSSSSCSAA